MYMPLNSSGATSQALTIVDGLSMLSIPTDYNYSPSAIRTTNRKMLIIVPIILLLKVFSFSFYYRESISRKDAGRGVAIATRRPINYINDYENHKRK